MNIRLIGISLLFLLSLTSGLPASPRDALWKKVDEAQLNGLPGTAIKELEPIIQGALADQAYAEAIRALGRKIVLEGSQHGNKPEENVRRMQAALATVPAEMKPAMEAILADWYWQYFRQNSWRLLKRTQTAETPGPDFRTWDLARLFAEIDRHFTAMLADEQILKATPITDYSDMLDRGSVPVIYRPTLFDFLTYEALKFYQSGEQAAIKAEDTFELTADSPVFADTAEFVSWQPVSTDETSPALKAIHLYQGLLKFHQADTDRSAFYEADLARLTFGFNLAIGPTKSDRYKAALARLSRTTESHEISARVRQALAAQVLAGGEPAKAHEIARRGYESFPDTAGGALCYNFNQQIETKSASLATEFVWNAPWPTLNVTYRNVTKVYFRAVPVDFAHYLLGETWGVARFDRQMSSSLLVTKSVLEWSADLPDAGDFQQHTQALPAPTTLPPGFYALIASHNPTFDDEDNQLSLVPIWISNLALITQTRPDIGTSGGFVLQADTGEPVVGATLHLWKQWTGTWTKIDRNITTDANGHFDISTAERGGQIILLAEYHGQTVSNRQPVHVNAPLKQEPEDTGTLIFTDRAIYRPGQTIHYKGIVIRANQTDSDYTTLADEQIDVVFTDANGKKIANATHESNAYGSFSGTFIAPRDQISGQMTIKVENGPKGSVKFSVEEYKRPKFQVDIPAPIEAAKLNGEVNLTGRATAYTGAAIGNARVKWRVERAVGLPAWCWWWQPPAQQAIAHGDALSAPDGSFKVQFTAGPDHSVPEKNEPVFSYTLYADVTDTTGETHSATRTINVGYTALQASLWADDWQVPDKAVAFKISTSTLDGVMQSAQGSLTIHALAQPLRVVRAALQPERHWWSIPDRDPPVDPANPDSWQADTLIKTLPFKTDALGTAQIPASLPAGIYRASLETVDRFGKKITARRTIHVLDPQAKRYPVKQPSALAAAKWIVDPGETFTALWGTGYESGRAFVELTHNGSVLARYWTAANQTQQRIELPITEEMRGGVNLSVTYVRENRAYLKSGLIDVPWTNKDFVIKWERFRSKLLPGQKETWTAQVSTTEGKHGAAEMVATLYDASLDQFRVHRWRKGFGVFPDAGDAQQTFFHNAPVSFDQYHHNWRTKLQPVYWNHSRFHYEIFNPWWRPKEDKPTVGDELMYDSEGEYLQLSPFTIETEEESGYSASSTLAGTRMRTELHDVGSAVSAQREGSVLKDAPDNEVAAGSTAPDLNKVAARKDLGETAFFLPHLRTNWRGKVKFQFTMPESLTEWRFLGFAHDKTLRAGLLTGSAVTAKELMVEPNPPRFVREGDTIEFTVKVSNQSDKPQAGRVRLTFADAESLKALDAALGNRETEQAFDLPAKQSRSYSWRIAIPDGLGFLTYKAVGATALASDGEEGFLPVLSRRILMTESLPLSIRGKTTRPFDFKKLSESGQSDTLRSQTLTVQMVSQPAWYAVMALPYLMEYPYECSEQLFNRLYANALARHIANSDPKIRRTFDLWKGTPTLDSPLTKNQDLKAVMIAETPWLRQANSESEGRRNVGLLFDAKRLDDETVRTLRQLAERQLSDGLWSWFPGGRSSEYISLYVMTGFGRLRHLGVEIDTTPAIRSLQGLDAWMDNRYRQILSHRQPDEYIPNNTDALYLYGRSFFLLDHPFADQHQPMIDFFLRQSRKYWPQQYCRQSQAHLALALQRFGDRETPLVILKSLKERSVTTEELGMFWRDLEPGWWWYQAPIETQTMMIEAFDEVAHDTQAVEDCKVWLLKQKQTQDWKTTKATADAIYGLLLHGTNLLASDTLVEVSLGGETIKPEKIEAGTGFYEQKFFRDEIKPSMGVITVKKEDGGVSWGSVHWQYLEDMAKATPHESTPLQLKKTLWVKETTNKGPVLKPVTGPVAVGDELVVRIELRADRDMEYVHLKDQRGSGTEPVNVLSQYKFQDGLAYYESTRDTASHFFIDYLPKGVYVFEYSTRVQLKGNYQTGVAEIQCMYAPEFDSHSESIALEVK